MKVLIVDGLARTRQYFRHQLLRYVTNAELVEAENAEDALFKFFEEAPDAVLTSDILSFRDGFSLSEILHSLNKNVPVIVLAGDESKALRAIKTKVFEYLILPVSKKKWDDTFSKLIDFLNELAIRPDKNYNKDIKLRISTTNGYKLINLDHLAYCMADGTYTNICFIDGSKEYSSYYLGKIEKTLLKYHFVRISRSVLVNMKLIKKIDKRKETLSLDLNGEIKDFRISNLNYKKLIEEEIL